MLYLDRPIGPIKGLQIYRDHADPNQFYYVPERPRLAMNGSEPEFIFLKYARDITDNPAFTNDQKKTLGGGLLAFTVDLSIDDRILLDVKHDLAQYSGGGAVALSPIMFEEGEVRLSMVKQKKDDETEIAAAGSMKIIEETWGSSKPSLYGNNRATFGVALSQEGATLMEESLKRGIGFIGVVYDLKFLGMRPSYNVKVTAEYGRIYNHFEAELGAAGSIGAVQLAADLAFAYQKLEEDGSIKVEVTTFTDDKDLKNQAEAAAKWAREKITEDLFKSALKPPSFMTRASKDPLSTLMSAFGRGLGGTLTNNRPSSRNAPPANTTTPARPGTNTPSRPNTPATPARSGGASNTRRSGPDNRGVTPGGTTPATNHTNTPDSQRSASQAGSGGSSTGGGVSPFKVALSLKYIRQEEKRKRVFEFSQQAAEKRSAAPQGLFTTIVEGKDLSDRIVSVNLDDEMFRRLVSDIGVVCNWENDGIELVRINAEYPGDLKEDEQPAHVDGYVFSPSESGRKSFTTWLNDKKDMSFRYNAEVHFKSTSPWTGKDSVLRGEWIKTRERQLVFNPLDKIGLLNVKIAADKTVDFQQVSQIIIQTEYNDQTSNFKTEKSFLLTAENKSAEWKLRLSDPNMKTVKWRAIYSLPDNVDITTDWETTEESSIIVGEPFEGMKRIRIIPTLKADEFIEAIVDVTYTGQSGYTKNFQEIFTPDNLKGRNLTVDSIKKDPNRYKYTITIIRSDGSLYTSPEKESDHGVIIVDDKDGQFKQINVSLDVDQAEWQNLYAVELQLKGPGGVTDSMVFTESNKAARKYTIGLKANGALEYEWSTTVYKRNGKVETGQPYVERDANLVATLR